MRVVAWIVEGTWPAVVDAVRDHAPAAAQITLLHVADQGVPELAHGSYAGLFGRGHRTHDPGTVVERLGADAGTALLDAAAARLGRTSDRSERIGRPEREVVAEAAGAGLLILARDGERTRLGPKSLGHACRFVVDHAPCPVLLVWPSAVPDLSTLPPEPPREPEPPWEPEPPLA